jgi:hypothetical protein
MKHQRHFGSAATSREALQIGELIAGLDRIVQILNSDIAAEEEQAKVFDRSQPEYPMLARTLAVRRDNLRETISALERQFAGIYRAQLDQSRPSGPPDSPGQRLDSLAAMPRNKRKLIARREKAAAGASG